MIQVLRSSWCFFCSNKLMLSKRIRTTGKQGRIVELEENSIPKMTSGLFYFLLLLLFSLSLVSYCLNCVCFYFQSFYQSQMLSTPHWSNPPDQKTQIQLLVLNTEDIYCKTDLYTFSLFFSLNTLLQPQQWPVFSAGWINFGLTSSTCLMENVNYCG